MNTNHTTTRETATPQQLANGEYEVNGIMGGQGRTPEEIIADTDAAALVLLCLLLFMGTIALLAAITSAIA